MHARLDVIDRQFLGRELCSAVHAPIFVSLEDP
jgi:hypothetical protein